MKYCNRCITPDTRPGLILDSEGICQGCRHFESLSKVDWKKRRDELNLIVNWAMRRSSYGYDCIVSVSGGKDSTRQALYMRDNLGMTPLLVCTHNPPEMTSKIGIDNLANLTELGFDTISITPNPVLYKKLMKKGLYEYGNYNKSAETVLYASAHRVAKFYNIPLIVLGENGSLVNGDHATNNDGGNAKYLRDHNTVKDGLDWMINKKENIDKQDLIAYDMPEINDYDIKAIYIGYYIKDFSQVVNGIFSMAFGLSYRKESVEDYGCLYNFSQVDHEFTQVNQLMKFYKFGFGKASEEISELIKQGIMTKETGILLALKLDGKCHERYIVEFCEYLEISIKDFNELLEECRNKDIWKKVDDKWIIKNSLNDELLRIEKSLHG
jgi:N-acetyl sugar amidotransferase